VKFYDPDLTVPVASLIIIAKVSLVFHIFRLQHLPRKETNMTFEACKFASRRTKLTWGFYCETHNLECHEAVSPYPDDPTRRVARCLVSGDLAGYKDTRPTLT